MVLYKRRHLGFLVLFLINFIVDSHGSAPRNEHKKFLELNLFSDQWIQELEAWISEPCSIEQVTFESDVHIQDDEFRYLVDINTNAVLTADVLKSAISNLKKKNKFKTIRLVLTLDNNQSRTLHINAEGLWTFKKITFHGPMVGKDIFRQYYLLEPSEPFDMQKHTHFIRAIKQAVEDQGYCNPVVADYLEYDRATKSVTVHCVLDQGVKFSIGSVNIYLNNSSQNSQPEYHHLIEKIIKKSRARVQGVYYTCHEVEREQQRLQEYVLKKGFLNAVVGLKKEIDIDHSTVALHFELDLKEKRVFSFIGNTFFSSKELLDHSIVFESSSYIVPPSMLIEEFVAFYKKHGFWSVDITVAQEHEHCCFTICEGPRAAIEHISLQGTEHFDQEILLKKFFGGIKKRAYFNADMLKDAVDNLILFYVSEGFWDCKLLKQEHNLSEIPDVYDMKLIIDEGQRRSFVSIDIPGFSELMREGPFEKVVSHMPIAGNPEIIQAQRQWLIQHFQQQGYLYVQVKPLCQEDEHDKNKLSLVWDIDLKNGPVTFGKTIVAGTCSFPIKNIIRQLHYKQGEHWDKHKLEQSVLDLRRLGIFESVYMSPYAIGFPESEKSILLKVVEDDPFEIRVRTGFQQVSKNLTFRSGTTYKVGGSLLYKNPGNVADFIRIDGDVTRFYRYLSAEYFRPWIFDLPVNMVLKGYSNNYTQPVRIGTDKPLYKATQEGVLLGLTYPIGRSKFGTNFGFEYMETSGPSRDLARAINFEPSLVDRKVPYVFFEPNIFIDLLDDKLNPTRGSLTIVSFKGMFSWEKGSVNFFKMLCEQSFFIPYNPLVLGVRFRFGHIFNQRLSAIMPPERFYLGGPYSLRGYEIDLAPPLGIFIDDQGKRCLVPQGGKTMFNGNVELRMQVYNRIGGTLFQDFGVLIEDSLAEISGNKLLAATGFGIRYQTPIGPLRLDIGWKWKRQKQETSSYAWFLTLGNAF